MSTTYFTPGESTQLITTRRIFDINQCGDMLIKKSLANVPFLSSPLAHEYCKVDGNIGTCGITDFAQAALGDIVFVDLPEVGDEFEKGDSFGSVESVKAASDVYAPVSGTVTEINEALTDEPGMVNSEAEGNAWFIKMELKDTAELDDLLGPDAYKEHCANEAH
jgi:glycine cleavage system H protein